MGSFTEWACNLGSIMKYMMISCHMAVYRIIDIYMLY